MKGLAALAILAAICCADTRVNPDAAIVGDFLKRIADYEQMVKTLDNKLPRLTTTGSQAAIEEHQHALANAIREARRNAKAGEIFSPQISTEFRRLIGIAMQGDAP